MVGGDAFGMVFAAHQETRIAAPRGCIRIAVAQIQTPARFVGSVGQGAVSSQLVEQQHASQGDRTVDNVTRLQILFHDPGLILVWNDTPPVAARDDLHSAHLHGHIHERNPAVHHRGVLRVAGEQCAILVKGPCGRFQKGRLRPRIELRMGQDLRAYQLLRQIDEGREGPHLEQTGGLVPFAEDHPVDVIRIVRVLAQVV